jgi:hypothetical protein
VHGNVQVDQVIGVAPNGALVHAQAAGQVGGGTGAAGLKDLQQGEHPGGRSGHGESFSLIPGILCPVFAQRRPEEMM